MLAACVPGLESLFWEDQSGKQKFGLLLPIHSIGSVQAIWVASKTSSPRKAPKRRPFKVWVCLRAPEQKYVILKVLVSTVSSFRASGLGRLRGVPVVFR